MEISDKETYKQSVLKEYQEWKNSFALRIKSNKALILDQIKELTENVNCIDPEADDNQMLKSFFSIDCVVEKIHGCDICHLGRKSACFAFD